MRVSFNLKHWETHGCVVSTEASTVTQSLKGKIMGTMIANWVGISQTLVLHGLTHTLLICFITITLWVMDGINFKLSCLNFCYINYWWVWLKYCPLFAPRYTSFILNHIMRLRAPWDLMYHELSLSDSMQALLVTPQGALDCAAILFYEELQMKQMCVRF